jgi:hypothetical protein
MASCSRGAATDSTAFSGSLRLVERGLMFLAEHGHVLDQLGEVLFAGYGIVPPDPQPTIDEHESVAVYDGAGRLRDLLGGLFIYAEPEAFTY